MPIIMNIHNNPFLQERFEEGRQEGRRQSALVLLSRQGEPSESMSALAPP